MASSSSSHQQNQRFNAFSGIEPVGKRRMVSESSTLFDVFINHRGPDVKLTLAIQLYNSLKEVGIRAFLDSEEKELGESFPSTIETAIKSAKVHIAIFSKRYAQSPWCLAELVLMLQTKAKIIPVFYGVEPWELRFIEKGEYAKAFTKYENEKRYLEKLPEWKEALQSLSFVAGEEFNGDCIDITAAVQKEVQKKICLHVATYPVGLDNLVEDFQRRCLNELVLDFENQCGLEEGKYTAKVVGIFGMGGVGKTTLAKELFNRKSSNYCRASFLFDVREASATGRLSSLQSKLLKDLFQDNHLNPISTEEGMSYLKDHLQRSPNVNFLIVVDDINHMEQLNALMIMDILNKFCNTLIIITTRDVGVLVRAGISDGYNLKGMDRNNGRELFCWHAFNQPHSSNGYETLVDAFVDVCGGLPLSLQVLGRHVHGKPDSFWRAALIQARKTLPQDVKHRLKISFDALSGEEKQIFMDIACFFIGEPKGIAERVWGGSGWNGQHSLEMLKDKCLVEETEIWVYETARHKKPTLRMHDHLRDLGREMASELSPPLRLWRRQDLQYLESTGLKNILAKNDLRCLYSMFDESMSCQVTFFLGQPDICTERSASVLWLELQGLPLVKFQCIPSWVSLQHVQYLKIQRGLLKTLWENHIQAPSQLKELQIGFCPELEELSLAHLSCLKEIAIENCYRLKSVLGINNLTKLVQLNISGCPELEELRLPHMGCMEKIAIRKCNHLKSVSGINNLFKLVELVISNCGKLEFERLCLSSMKCLESIIFDRNVEVKYFELDGCQNLKAIKYGCEKLTRLGFSRPELEKLLVFEGLICLERIRIDGRGQFKDLVVKDCQSLKSVSGNLEIVKLRIYACPELEELPSFSSPNCMKEIHVESCGKLQNFMLPTILVKLSLKYCRDLQRVIGTGDLLEIKFLWIYKCPELEELPRFSSLNCMKEIHITACRKLQSIMLSTRLVKLTLESCTDCQRVIGTGYFLDQIKFLCIYKCPKLEELPNFSSLSCIEEINITSCGKLQNIMVPTRLIRLSLESCEVLQRVKGTGDLVEIKFLYIYACPELEELPSFSSLSCAENIDIAFCRKLQSIMLPTRLIKLSVRFCKDLQRVAVMGDLLELKFLCIYECPELEELPIFSSLSCTEEIHITSCGKLQNIVVPTRLIKLFVRSCRDLQRVVATGDLIELKFLCIYECPELEELPSFSSLSCMEGIKIDSSEKLQNMAAGIEELHVSRIMKLCYCSNAEIRNRIRKLKSVPKSCVVIGRAADGAESTLNEYLFSDADAVTEIDISGSVTILCCLVVVDSSISVEDVNESLLPYSPDIKVRPGEWIITVLGQDSVGETSDVLRSYEIMMISDVLTSYGIMKKGFWVEVKKENEWESGHMLNTIVDRLYHL